MEEIENAHDFVKNIEKIELPNQLVAVLADPLLQKLLLLRPSEESQQRIVNWLNAVLQDVMDGDADEDTLFDVLDVVRDFVVSTKVGGSHTWYDMCITDTLQALPPLLLNFFARFLKLWDGSGRRESLFEILSYSPLLEFNGRYRINPPRSHANRT